MKFRLTRGMRKCLYLYTFQNLFSGKQNKYKCKTNPLDHSLKVSLRNQINTIKSLIHPHKMHYLLDLQHEVDILLRNLTEFRKNEFSPAITRMLNNAHQFLLILDS